MTNIKTIKMFDHQLYSLKNICTKLTSTYVGIHIKCVHRHDNHERKSVESSRNEILYTCFYMHSIGASE